MKRLVLTLIIMLSIFGSWAFNGYKNLYLHLDDGTVHRFEMNSELTIKYKPTEFIIINQGVVYNYPRESVISIKYEADLSGSAPVIAPVETAICKVQGDQLLLTSVDAEGDLYIYSVDGRMIKSAHVDSDNLTVSLSDLQSGIYIVNLNDKSEKILVK